MNDNSQSFFQSVDEVTKITPCPKLRKTLFVAFFTMPCPSKENKNMRFYIFYNDEFLLDILNLQAIYSSPLYLR